ncbi:ribonuclease D [Oceanibacterium hippocampi]|uniref:Ribonuclease D n=1 Tax=Oceanibacterium hippocampi TaxID=745714 RepID=A0A1Y5SV61_9PROT|nr:ribonuclease D [Oceanibacterium hippocampi]SLN48790.1 Ribonuclease D [Oceanibacterium hippocampi]
MKVITDTAALEAACEPLHAAEYVTVDTEFMRENSYWPHLCLIQLAGPDDAMIIDPLAEGISLDPLLRLLADEAVLKVFHAARQDVEIFYHLSGRVPKPIFDTQIAAMVCGFGDSAAYDTLVRKLARAEVDKSSRFTDWARRPLAKRQLEYALSDVTHLRVIYEKLKRRLDESGRTPWLAEEMAVLCDPKTYAMEPDRAWQRLKTRNNKPRFLAILQELAAWRELQAQAKDIPRNRILRDESLLEIAAHPPSDQKELSAARGVSRGLAEGRSGQEMLAAIARGKERPESECPSSAPKLPPAKGIGPLMELLKVLLKYRSEEADVAQKLIANTADLERIAAEDEPDVAAMRGWRREIFGNDALALKAGRVALAAGRRQVKLVRLSGD